MSLLHLEKVIPGICRIMKSSRYMKKLLSVWSKVQSAQSDGEGGLDYHSWKECVTNEVTMLYS